ncbi:hypothetical protein HDV05_003137, partial [Chytridiales sp. JEL 0842]
MSTAESPLPSTFGAPKAPVLKYFKKRKGSGALNSSATSAASGRTEKHPQSLPKASNANENYEVDALKQGRYPSNEPSKGFV